MYCSGIWIQLIWGLLDQCFQKVVIMAAAGVVAISKPDWQGPCEMGVRKLPKPVWVELLKGIVIKRLYWELSWMPICIFFAITFKKTQEGKASSKVEEKYGFLTPSSDLSSFFFSSLQNFSLYSKRPLIYLWGHRMNYFNLRKLLQWRVHVLDIFLLFWRGTMTKVTYRRRKSLVSSWSQQGVQQQAGR